MVGDWLPAVSTALMLAGWTPEAREPYRIIVNTANPTSSVSTAQLSKMFLDGGRWDHGEPVLAVDQHPASPVREAFSKTVLGMTPDAVAARWTASSAPGRVPLTLSSDADVIQYVRLKLGAIGYVSAAADVSGVKVLTVDGAARPVESAAASDRLIRSVLGEYTSALQKHDLQALRRVWPTMNPAQTRAMRAQFEQTRTVRVQLVDPRIEVNGDTAVVQAQRLHLLATTSGTTTRVVTMTTLTLRNVQGSWTIEDVRYRTER